MTILYDRATIEGQARITPEGYFVADARVAQANNIQTYYARELGMTDRDPNDVVRVFRPEAEVFAADSLATAVRLPITLDHPSKMVDASNWREFTRGETGDEVLRDGEFMRVPLRVTDAGAVHSVQTDRQEFSLGYSTDLKMTPGVHDGQAYDAVATNFRYNHLAACRTARGGPQLRIVDERPALIGDSPMPHIVIVDGLPVDVANPETAATVVKNAVAARDTANAALVDAGKALDTANVTIAARDAEIVTLKDAAAKASDPTALRDAAASYSRTVTLAKALGATVTDAMDEPAVKAAAVTHKMGDKAAKYTADQVQGAFDALVAGLGDKAPPVPVVDALAAVISDGLPANLADGATKLQDARNARFDRYANAHKGAVSAPATQH